MPTLKYRRIRGDMIETYKIITGIYDREASPVLKLNLSTITRGNQYKLDTHRTKYCCGLTVGSALERISIDQQRVFAQHTKNMATPF